MSESPSGYHDPTLSSSSLHSHDNPQTSNRPRPVNDLPLVFGNSITGEHIRVHQVQGMLGSSWVTAGSSHSVLTDDEDNKDGIIPPANLPYDNNDEIDGDADYDELENEEYDEEEDENEDEDEDEDEDEFDQVEIEYCDCNLCNTCSDLFCPHCNLPIIKQELNDLDDEQGHDNIKEEISDQDEPIDKPIENEQQQLLLLHKGPMHPILPNTFNHQRPLSLVPSADSASNIPLANIKEEMFDDEEPFASGSLSSSIHQASNSFADVNQNQGNAVGCPSKPSPSVGLIASTRSSQGTTNELNVKEEEAEELDEQMLANIKVEMSDEEEPIVSGSLSSIHQESNSFAPSPSTDHDNLSDEYETDTGESSEGEQQHAGRIKLNPTNNPEQQRPLSNMAKVDFSGLSSSIVAATNSFSPVPSTDQGAFDNEMTIGVPSGASLSSPNSFPADDHEGYEGAVLPDNDYDDNKRNAEEQYDDDEDSDEELNYDNEFLTEQQNQDIIEEALGKGEPIASVHFMLIRQPSISIEPESLTGQGETDASESLENEQQQDGQIQLNLTRSPDQQSPLSHVPSVVSNGYSSSFDPTLNSFRSLPSTDQDIVAGTSKDKMTAVVSSGVSVSASMPTDENESNDGAILPNDDSDEYDDNENDDEGKNDSDCDDEYEDYDEEEGEIDESLDKDMNEDITDEELDEEEPNVSGSLSTIHQTSTSSASEPSTGQGNVWDRFEAVWETIKKPDNVSSSLDNEMYGPNDDQEELVEERVEKLVEELSSSNGYIHQQRTVPKETKSNTVRRNQQDTIHQQGPSTSSPVSEDIPMEQVQVEMNRTVKRYILRSQSVTNDPRSITNQPNIQNNHNKASKSTSTSVSVPSVLKRTRRLQKGSKTDKRAMENKNEEEEDEDEDEDEFIPVPVKRSRQSHATISSSEKKQIIIHKLKCPECPENEAMFKKEKFDKHMKDQHGILKYRCEAERCEKSFINGSCLGRHVSQEHSDISQWYCGYCSKQFKTYIYLSDHIRNRHQLGYFQCKFPKCTFEGEFKKQIYTHYDNQHKKKLECHHPGCQYQAISASKLEKHERTHSGIKPYRCKWPKCLHTTAEQGNMIKHIFVHFASDPTTAQNGRLPVDPKEYVEVVNELL